MYGIMELFRSTYLATARLDRRPDSIGKAIPNAELMGKLLAQEVENLFAAAA